MYERCRYITLSIFLEGRPGSRKFQVIFITGQLDSPSDPVPLQKAAKKVHDSGGKIIAYKLNDFASDVRVIPKDQIIKVGAKDDPWRLAMLFDFQTRKCEKYIFIKVG